MTACWSLGASVVADPSVRDLWACWGRSLSVKNTMNLMPGQFYEQAAIPTAQEVLSAITMLPAVFAYVHMIGTATM